MSVAVLIGAALAGGLGAGLRYTVDALVSGRRSRRLPVGILVVNLTGSFALGVLTGVGAGIVDSETAWIVGVGFLGGYTTFSAVSVDSVLLIASGELRRGWSNAVGTLMLGIVAALAGLGVGGLLTP